MIRWCLLAKYSTYFLTFTLSYSLMTSTAGAEGNKPRDEQDMGAAANSDSDDDSELEEQMLVTQATVDEPNEKAKKEGTGSDANGNDAIDDDDDEAVESTDHGVASKNDDIMVQENDIASAQKAAKAALEEAAIGLNPDRDDEELEDDDEDDDEAEEVKADDSETEDDDDDDVDDDDDEPEEKDESTKQDEKDDEDINEDIDEASDDSTKPAAKPRSILKKPTIANVAAKTAALIKAWTAPSKPVKVNLGTIRANSATVAANALVPEDAAVKDAAVKDAAVKDAPVKDAPVKDAPVKDAPVKEPAADFKASLAQARNISFPLAPSDAPPQRRIKKLAAAKSTIRKPGGLKDIVEQVARNRAMEKKRAAAVPKAPAAKKAKTSPASAKKKSPGSLVNKPNISFSGPPDDNLAGGWPPGWRKETHVRKGGKTKGSSDNYWFTPHENYKLRSMAEIKRFMTALTAARGDEKEVWRTFKGK